VIRNTYDRDTQAPVLTTDFYSAEDHGVLSDSAFPVSNWCFNKILTPLKDGELERSHPSTRRALQIRSDCIVFLRQPAEWAQGAVDKVYRILIGPLPFNPVVRGRRLLNLYRLLNFRTRMTGISQIRSYFYNDVV
jgi:hypothetical protein